MLPVFRVCALLFSLLGSAASAAAPARLTIDLPDGQSVVLDTGAFADLPRTEAKATAHGQTHTFAGWDVLAVLEKAGLSPVRGLRGALLRRVVRIEAADGYGVVYAMAELDPEIGARRVLLADRQDGAALPESDGPLRLVAPEDKRSARWARQVVRIVVQELHASP